MAEVLEKPKGFYDVFERKPGRDKDVTHYCPGCGHGRIHKLIAEAMDQLEIGERTVFISPVGCSVFGYYYFNCGNIQAAHGRAPAIATAVSRSNPDSIVISYQGDGDLAAIGTAEIIHAANRGENMTVIFVNNGIYGMTGGQMAPTTMEGQKTTTTPFGRDVSTEGFPMRMSEIVGTLEAPVYVERVTLSDIKGTMKTKKAIGKALKAQKDRKGFSFVEILSPCPVGWKMTPVDAMQYMKDVVEPYFPVKLFKDEIKDRGDKPRIEGKPTEDEIMSVLGFKDLDKMFPHDQSFVDNFKEQRLRIAGFGGQGVLMAGTTLSLLGMEHGLNVTWLPSYGPEMRGGTANCHVVLSNQTVGAPMVENPNVLIAMNRPSLDEFEGIVEKDGLIIVNSAIIDRKVEREDVTAVYIPVTEIAESLGVRAAANMAVLTAYLAFTGVMEVERLVTLITKHFKKKELLEKNFAVIEKAHQYVKEHCK